jgi:chromosome partitioning protein
MFIVTMTGAKGGAGKTGVAVQLAGEAHRRGLRVLLVDADPRGVALTWHRHGVHTGRQLPDCIGVGDDVGRVQALAAGYDLTLIDTEGKVGKRLSRALEIADLALLPVKPEPGDLWVLSESITAVRRKMERYPVRGHLVLCCAHQTRLGKAAAGEVARAALPSFATVLKRSQKYSDTQNVGRYVTEQHARTEEAEQLRALLGELLSLSEGAVHAA